jgi:hypothetical protein
MRTGARGSPSWPEQLLRGRIHYGRLFETNSAQIHLQIGGGPYIRLHTGPATATRGRGANAERPPMPPTTSADDTLIAAHLASGILAATMRVASVENPAAQAPLAAKLYFDCHDALRAERKRRYEV